MQINSRSRARQLANAHIPREYTRETPAFVRSDANLSRRIFSTTTTTAAERASPRVERAKPPDPHNAAAAEICQPHPQSPLLTFQSDALCVCAVVSADVQLIRIRAETKYDNGYRAPMRTTLIMRPKKFCACGLHHTALRDAADVIIGHTKTKQRTLCSSHITNNLTHILASANARSSAPTTAGGTKTTTKKLRIKNGNSHIAYESTHARTSFVINVPLTNKQVR